jgi:hypothetical protein
LHALAGTLKPILKTARKSSSRDIIPLVSDDKTGPDDSHRVHFGCEVASDTTATHHISVVQFDVVERISASRKGALAESKTASGQAMEHPPYVYDEVLAVVPAWRSTVIRALDVGVVGLSFMVVHFNSRVEGNSPYSGGVILREKTVRVYLYASLEARLHGRPRYVDQSLPLVHVAGCSHIGIVVENQHTAH